MIEAVCGELLFFLQPNVTVGRYAAGVWFARPHDVVDRVRVLQKLRQSFQPIRDLAGDRVQIKAAALLEVGELRDFLAVHHHLPADAPRATNRPFPVVFFKLDVVIA